MTDEDPKGGTGTLSPGALTALLEAIAAAPPQPEGAEPAPLQPGTRVGRYEIVRELDRGAFGVVHEARDRELGRSVALKLVRPGRSGVGEAQLAREAEAIARLSHPNLVTVHDIGQSEHGPYLVFELLRGETLEARLDRGPVPVKEAVRLGLEVARGLAYAHAEGVVHRDLKPSNAFVTAKGQVKLLDFGMAHAFGRKRVSGGTPAYMAPEQWEGDPEDERTDVFALGVMLYRMLSGEHPFPEDGGKWSSGPAEASRLSVAGVPELEELVSRMLSKAPRGRPRDGGEVLAVLERIAGSLPAGESAGSLSVQTLRRKATLADLWAELRRRRVFRALIGYGIFSFAVLQVIEPVMRGAHLPEWAPTAVPIALAVGFPVTAVLAWVFDLTSQGVKRTPSGGEALSPMSGHLAALLVGIGLAAALPGVAWYVWKRGREAAIALARPDGRIAVAVTDFANETRDPDLDGLSVLLITSLEQSRRLAVLTRTRMLDVARQAGRDKVERIDEVVGREIGLKVGARAVLVPAIQRFDDTYVVELRAIDPHRDSPLFSIAERAVGKAAIPELIDRLGERARRELREPAQEIAKNTVPVAQAVTGSLDAYEHYFRGIQLQEAVRMELAIAEYRQATRIDPAFALAYYRIAYAGNNLNLPAEETRAAIDAAMRHVDRAPEKDRLLIRAWDAKLRGLDEEAERIYAQAAAAYGDDKQVSFMAGEHLIHWGRVAESLPHFERAISLDPTWEWARVHLVDDLLALGRFDEALSRAREWVKAKPDADTWRWLSRALNANGRFAEAEDAGRRAMTEHTGPWNWPGYWSRFAVADALIRLDRFAEAEEILGPVVAESAAAYDRARTLPVKIEVLSYEGRRREATALANALRFEGASAPHRLGLLIQQRLAAGAPIRQEVDEALRLGIPPAQLATWTAMSGDVDGGEKLASRLASGSLERQLFDAVAAWRRGKLDAAAARFTSLAAEPTLDYACVARFALGEIAIERGRDQDAIAMLESFGRTPVVSWHLGTPPPEIYRWFFAGPFRSWAYPRSLYLLALARHRTRDDGQARDAIDHLLSLWAHADPDLPLLREGRALRARLAKGEPARAR